MIKVNWDNLPKEANYVAMDSCGLWMWYTHKPILLPGRDHWSMNSDDSDENQCDVISVSKGEFAVQVECVTLDCVTLDWTETIVERPTE